MLEVRNQEWLDANSNRAYPLSASATQQDVTKSFTIPKDFIVEVQLSVPVSPSVNPANFFIMSVTSFTSGYGLVIGYQSASGPVPVASAIVARDAQLRRFTPYRLAGVGNFLDVVGYVVIGTLDTIDLQPTGKWTFGLADAQLEQDAVLANIRNVVSLQVQNGTQLSPLIYGDVVLQAGANMQISTSVNDDGDTVVTLSAIAAVADNGQYIRSINGIGPTSEGDFSILGDRDCIAVAAIPNGIQFQDTCSSPCCGCAELEALTHELEQLGTQMATMNIFLTNLEAAVTQMDQAVAGSMFGDRGCS